MSDTTPTHSPAFVDVINEGDYLMVHSLRTRKAFAFNTHSESGTVVLDYAATLRLHEDLGRRLGLSTPTPTAPLTASRSAAHRTEG